MFGYSIRQRAIAGGFFFQVLFGLAWEFESEDICSRLFSRRFFVLAQSPVEGRGGFMYLITFPKGYWSKAHRTICSCFRFYFLFLFSFSRPLYLSCSIYFLVFTWGRLQTVLSTTDFDSMVWVMGRVLSREVSREEAAMHVADCLKGLKVSDNHREDGVQPTNYWACNYFIVCFLFSVARQLNTCSINTAS